MRIEWKDTEDMENVGQFIVYADNEIEGALLRRFTNQGQKGGWKFWLHGSCYNMRQVTSFNFGFIKEK